MCGSACQHCNGCRTWGRQCAALCCSSGSLLPVETRSRSHSMPIRSWQLGKWVPRKPALAAKKHLLRLRTQGATGVTEKLVQQQQKPSCFCRRSLNLIKLEIISEQKGWNGCGGVHLARGQPGFCCSGVIWVTRPSVPNVRILSAEGRVIGPGASSSSSLALLQVAVASTWCLDIEEDKVGIQLIPFPVILNFAILISSLKQINLQPN